MNHVTEIFGSMVFDDATMKEKLPRDVYKALKRPSRSENRSIRASPTRLPTR